MKIEIDNVEYELDIERAKLNGSLKRAAIKAVNIRPGDVYNHPERKTNAFVVIEAIYGVGGCYQLLGMGASTNSNAFFHTIHTREEIADYLNDKEMLFTGRNISQDIAKLVGP